MDLTVLWNTAIVHPLTEGLRFLYGIFGSYGLAIIAFTIIIRVVMIPLSMQQLKSSKSMQELQPEIQALQKKYAKEKEKLSQETMKLYKERGVNPMAGCLPTLIQMPIWLGLYSALLTLSTTPEFASGFLWIGNIAAQANMSNPLDWVLPVLTVISQWIVQKMMTPVVQDPQQKSMNSMMAFMPLMFGYFAFQVPAGLVLYWTASNIFSLVQQYFTTGWGALAPTVSAITGKKGESSLGFLDSFRGLLPASSADQPVTKKSAVSATPTKTVQKFDQVVQPVTPGASKQKPKRRK